MLRRLLLIICAAPLLGNAHAQQNPPVAFDQEADRGTASRVSYSLSKQFVIHSQPRTGWLPALGPNPDVVRLEPNLLAVSCERIKHVLMRELGVTADGWRGRIDLQLHPARNLGETIHATSTSIERSSAGPRRVIRQLRLIVPLSNCLGTSPA